MTKNNNATPLRAFLYSRVSTENQKDNTSHETQREACEHWAQRHGALVVRYYFETISGTEYEMRSELQKALSDLESDAGDVIVFYDASRFSRDILNAELILRRIHAAGKRIAFCDMEMQYDEDGELTGSSVHLDIRNILSKSERIEIRKRTMRGRYKRVAEGKMPGGTDLFGYHKYTKADEIRGLCRKEQIGTYTVVEEQAQVVHEIFNLYEGGATIGAIAKLLNERGHRTLAGVPFRYDYIYTLLKNQAFKGQAQYGKTRAVVDDARRRRGLKTRVVQAPRPAHEIKVISCPAIIEEAQWERVNGRLQSARTRFGGRKDRVYALRGLLRCPLCKSKMNGHRVARKQRDADGVPLAYDHYYRYYRCQYSIAQDASFRSREENAPRDR